MTVVLDTNVVIRMFGAQSRLRPLVEAISYGAVEVAVSPSIWLEYEEVCMRLERPATGTSCKSSSPWCLRLMAPSCV